MIKFRKSRLVCSKISKCILKVLRHLCVMSRTVLGGWSFSVGPSAKKSLVWFIFSQFRISPHIYKGQMEWLHKRVHLRSWVSFLLQFHKFGELYVYFHKKHIFLIFNSHSHALNIIWTSWKVTFEEEYLKKYSNWWKIL